MTDWYTASGWPGQGSPGASAPGRAEFVAIAANFLKMPILTGRANRPIFVNASGTGLNSPTAADARTYLGGTTIGQAFFTLPNPGDIRFPRINANNTLSVLAATDFVTAIGATDVGKALFTAVNPNQIRFLRVNEDNTISLLTDVQMATAMGVSTTTTFNVDHAADGSHNKTMLNAGTTPAPTSTQLVLYCKIVSGFPEFFIRDGVSGVELQVTRQGALNVDLPDNSVTVQNLTSETVFALTVSGEPIQLTIQDDSGTSYAEIDWSLGTSFSLTLNQNLDELRFTGMDAAEARSITVEINVTGAYDISSFVPNGTWVVMKPIDSELAVVHSAVMSYGCALFPAERMHVFPVQMEEHAP